jgi:hypothetical protein
MMLGQGRAQAIGNDDMAALASKLGCHPATLEAIAEVESGGFGWFPDGRIKILPEPHKFHSALPVSRRAQALRLGLATKSYAATRASGHYRRMTNGPGPRYALLQRMIDYDADAAFEAISIGKFQIMGFNHETCGFPSARAMFDAFTDSEVRQLHAFSNFLVKNGLRPALARADFDTVEEVYNGGGLNGVYAARMRAEAAALRKGKWANWPNDWPGKGVAAVQPPPSETAAPPLPSPPAPEKVAPAPAAPLPAAPVAVPPPPEPEPVPAAPGFFARLVAAFRRALGG